MLQMSSCFICLCAEVSVWSSTWHLVLAWPPTASKLYQGGLFCVLPCKFVHCIPCTLYFFVSVVSLAPSCLCSSMKSLEKELQRLLLLMWWQSYHQHNTGFLFPFACRIRERALRHLTLPQLQGRTHDVSGLASFVLFLIWIAASYLDWFLSLGKKM